MTTYTLLSGEPLDLSGLANEERRYLEELVGDAGNGVDYFDLLRRVKGRDALPLRGGAITPVIVSSVLYRAAHDIADRVGIEQGYLLAPDVKRPTDLGVDDDLLSLTEAARVIGITRPAAHQAVKEERLRGRRVGNAWVIRRRDAEEFKLNRSQRLSTQAETASA